ncbi:hypothetical protein Bbelb_150500 [Branchiostoma belcheri]|nr:hypothetical protein Bbelb_150500 [Branchiostoma belcheri]
MRLVMTEAPGDQMQEYQARWQLTDAVVMTRLVQTRPDDLKTHEEYQLTAVMTLNPTRPDVRVLRNLVTGNFSPVQTSKSDDLKTQLGETCDDQRLLSKPDQMRAEKTG